LIILNYQFPVLGNIIILTQKSKDTDVDDTNCPARIKNFEDWPVLL
ncbi:unnamed protein product, partial [Allacma fusca]